MREPFHHSVPQGLFNQCFPHCVHAGGLPSSSGVFSRCCPSILYFIALLRYWQAVLGLLVRRYQPVPIRNTRSQTSKHCGKWNLGNKLKVSNAIYYYARLTLILLCCFALFLLFLIPYVTLCSVTGAIRLYSMYLFVIKGRRPLTHHISSITITTKIHRLQMNKFTMQIIKPHRTSVSCK